MLYQFATKTTDPKSQFFLDIEGGRLDAVKRALQQLALTPKEIGDALIIATNFDRLEVIDFLLSTQRASLEQGAINRAYRIAHGNYYNSEKIMARLAPYTFYPIEEQGPRGCVLF